MTEEKTTKTDRFSLIDDALKQLESSINNNSEAIKNQTAAITQLNINNAQFQTYWAKSVPIKLVYYIVGLVVAGQSAIAALKYLIP